MTKLLPILLLFFTQVSFGEIRKVAFSEPASVEHWEVIDLVFKAKVKIDNPFIASFSATFEGPDNRQLNIPGFYNGNDEWIVRFSSSTPGAWTFETISEIRKLSAKNGIVHVKASTDAEKHGALVLNANNPQHFYYEDGTPYFQLAFECDWLFALDYHNETGTPKTEHLLSLLNDHRINQIVTTMYSFDVSWPKDPRLAEHPEHEFGGDLAIFPFLGTNENPDFSQLNIDFFQKYDRVISATNDHNITLHLMIYVWNKLVSWPDAETEADNMYFDYIIKRYQAFPNVVWDVSKEALNNKRCTEAYGLERIERIRKLDVYNRLVSVHDFGFCNRNSEAVDFISVQNWNLKIYPNMLEIRNKFKNKPVFNIEHGGYELSPYVVFPGNYISPEYCLKRNYEIAFAGVYSTYYWQGASWNALIHNPFELPDDFVKPRFDYYKHFVQFFTKFPFSEFEPDPRSSTYSLTNNKGTTLVFVPKENYQISIYGNSPLSGDTGTVQWFNTLTGEYTAELPYDGGHGVNPWHEQADAILIRTF